MVNESVFFIYDHNMLKKEEDDLKDAIIYFQPENWSADDQVKLCCQLMGLTEYLQETISRSSPRVFKFQRDKYGIKTAGAYSLVLQGGKFLPDSVLLAKLDALYEAFVTFHGSIDSLKLRWKGSQGEFVTELGRVWKTLLEVTGACQGYSISQTFQGLPYTELPRAGSQLFLQASQILQSSQRRPYVLAGVILYKNSVLNTQLPPKLTKHLTYLRNKMPHITKDIDYELPRGCKIVTIFLKDKDYHDICPLDPLARHHCNATDFSQSREKDPMRLSAEKANPSKPSKLTRRLTCPALGLPVHEHPQSATQKTLKTSLTNEQKKAIQRKQQEVLSAERSPWGRDVDRGTRTSLSHVPIVECRSGESAVESEGEVINEGVPATQIEEKYRMLPSSGDGEHEEESDTDTEGNQSNNSVTTHITVTGTNNIIDSQGNNVEQGNYDTGQVTADADPAISDLEDNEDEDVKLDTKQNMHSPGANAAVESDSTHKFICEQINKNSKAESCPQNSSSADQIHVKLNLSSSEERSVRSYDNLSDHETKVVKTEGVHSVLKHSADIHTGMVGNSSYKDEIIKEEHLEGTLKVNLDVRSEHCDEEVANGYKIEEEKENVNPNIDIIDRSFSPVSQKYESEIETEDEGYSLAHIEPCINCLELQSSPQNHSRNNQLVRCSNCIASYNKQKMFGVPNIDQEIMDFRSAGRDGIESGTETEGLTDMEKPHIKIRTAEIMSSFSSDVSTDSTISRYWTHEMEGLNDVTVYVQCHADISLLLLMENPEQLQENLFHALWKGSLASLADLDFHIKECLETAAEDVKGDAHAHDLYKYLHCSTYTAHVKGTISDQSQGDRRGNNLHQMLAGLHSDFQSNRCLSDVTYRSHFTSCYGHSIQGDESYFQFDISQRATSGLPLPRDPVYSMDVSSRAKIAKERKLSIL
ncbi:uncharacterized protein LOC128232640 isoform X2 [Mya arenaria]|uniref:uncharacterized protein LOC128232640 isoform X2 n=1 Tax=Mya arenaria TaxID=6604 RepID=UPI0022E1C5EB|nr:uncharacterized protein LOC128232640 isoform X2 [Mya arenaria]